MFANESIVTKYKLLKEYKIVQHFVIRLHYWRFISSNKLAYVSFTIFQAEAGHASLVNLKR